jgi:dipeptidyl aminopeptidase/acylaminoacyl peptidase
LGLLAAVAAVLLLIGGAAGASPDLTALVSLNSNGIQGSSDSLYPCISTDGRYVAFTSYATNLVENDTNATSDIFVRDREAWATTRVSVKTDGTQGNDASSNCAISADGRYVAFESYATNLVDNDTNGKRDVFVHDRQTGTTTRVSVKSDGSEANARSEQSAISGDGRYVAFQSQASNLVDGDTNGLQDVFVHDRQTGATTRASVKSDGSQGNGPSYYPSISDDGRYVAFDSRASNLVDGDSNGASDVFVHDRQTGATTRVSVKTDGSEGNNDSDRSTISADGRFVAFASYATNLVEGDTNATKDIFLHDRQAAVTSRVSVDSGGIQGNSYSD